MDRGATPLAGTLPWRSPQERACVVTFWSCWLSTTCSIGLRFFTLFWSEGSFKGSAKKKQDRKDKRNKHNRDGIKVILPLVRANNIEIGLKRVPGTLALICELILRADAKQLGTNGLAYSL